MGANQTKIDDMTLRQMPTEQVHLLSNYMKSIPKHILNSSTNNSNNNSINATYNYSSTAQKPVEYKGEYHNNIKELSDQIVSKNQQHTVLTDSPFGQTVPGINPTLSYQRAVSAYRTEAVRPGIHKIIDLEPTGAVHDTNSDSSSLSSLINFCESYKVNSYDSSICNAFNSEKFRNNCGVCLKPTTGTGDRTHIGGMYIDPDIRASFITPNSTETPSPTIGMCSPGYFVLDMSACKLLDSNKKCKESANYDNQGCAQCLIDGSWHYLENNIQYSTPKIVVKGVGKLVVSKSNGLRIGEVTLSNVENAINIELNSLEGDTIQINVSQINELDNIYLAGYLTGPTLTGTFSSDLARLIDTDLITNARPRIIGFQEMTTGSQAVKMTSGINNPEMKLVLRIPYSFISPDEVATNKCSTGPFIRTSKSADSLGLNKCKKQQNGSYNADCLQDIFVRGGCNQKGSLYPTSSTPNRITELNSYGSTPEEILRKVQEMSAISITGKNTSGTTVSAQDRNIASTKCHGITMSNVCELVDQNGRVSPDCLNYLYTNQGASNSIGSTYDTINASSLIGTFTGYESQYCTSDGKINPNGKDEIGKKAIIRAMAHTLNGQKGTVTSVKDFYNNIHKQANASITTTNRETIIAAIDDCYGITLQQQQQQQQQGFQNFTNKTIRGRDIPFTYTDTSQIDTNSKYAKWVN